MMAGHIMPVNTITVEVVKYCKAVFCSSILQFFSIIRLRYFDTVRIVNMFILSRSLQLSYFYQNQKTYPPELLQSFWFLSVVGGNFWRSEVQNQPFVLLGCRSALSHPLKSQMRPDVQMYLTLSNQQNCNSC